MFLQLYTPLHVFFYKLSGGRIGERIHKANVLLLTIASKPAYFTAMGGAEENFGVKVKVV